MPARRLTEAEAAVLAQHLPAGLTEEMRDVAWCLFEAMALLDSRAGAQQPGPVWLGVLHAMARVATAQLQHLAAEKGGKAIYLAKGVAAMLAARDELIWREFNGRNYAELARRHGLTEMRVRQIVAEQRARDMAQRQGRLPGLDDQG